MDVARSKQNCIGIEERAELREEIIEKVQAIEAYTVKGLRDKVVEMLKRDTATEKTQFWIDQNSGEEMED